jgi:hypothetical protein
MKPVCHLYCRISHPDQRKGRGLERQLAANVEDFCQRFGFTLGKHIYTDDGISAWKGANATPEHQLGQFLDAVRRGSVRPGDCLAVENYDRLSRQDPWSAVGLVGELRQLGIHIGRLDRMKLLRCDSDDPGDFFETSLEFMRGNSESSIKSKRIGEAWKAKRKAARDKKALLTRNLPAWISERDGKLVLVKPAVAAIRRVFYWAANGLGEARIVRKLTAEGVAAIGRSQRWTRSFISELLCDRRVLGELQPRTRGGAKDGSPIAGYFPRAITDAMWYAARVGREARKQSRAHAGKKYVELFSGLLFDVRGGPYHAATRIAGGTSYRILVNTRSAEGHARATTFPLTVFEHAVLEWLREIDPQEILGHKADDKLAALEAELADVRGQLVVLRADLAERTLRTSLDLAEKLEAREEELAEQVEDARASASKSTQDCWHEAGSLIDALAKAKDVEDVRLRLRRAIRRVVESIHLAVHPVPGTRERLAFIQVRFRESGHARVYAVVYRGAIGNGHQHQPARYWATCLDTDSTKPLDKDIPPERVARLCRTICAIVEAKARGEEIEIVED